MQTDWKHEQELVKQQQKDIAFCKDQMNRKEKANEQQAAIIQHLKEELKIAQSTAKTNDTEAAIRASRESLKLLTMDQKQHMEQATKSAKDIQDLQDQLAQRSVEYEQAMADIEEYEKSIEILNDLKNKMEEDIAEA